MFSLESKQRAELWKQIAEAIETYNEQVDALPVDACVHPSEVRSFLSAINFEKPWSPTGAIDFAVEGMRRFHVHNANPRYFGLFVPPAAAMGIAGDMLTSAFNLVLGGWALSPFGVELEQRLISEFAAKFGYPPEDFDGIFTAGGTEANHTALLCALTVLSPAIKDEGLASFGSQPLIYTSKETHHSILKVAMLCGLGKSAVREIEVNDKFEMIPDLLEAAISNDRAAGKCPCMVVATAGTTNAGAIDPLDRIAEIARRNSVWFHADAAWGGAAVLVPELHDLLHGISAADSITFDVHKWMSVPMTAGIFLTRHRDVLEKTFNVSGPYMPAVGKDAAIDPFRHSMQWSRPCRGLKVLLSLAVGGWQGYEQTLRRQIEMGNYLRDKLRRGSWKIVNDTPLPVVCFQDATNPEGQTQEFLGGIVRHALASGRVWISLAKLAGRENAIRACITHFSTQKKDVDELMEVLEAARSDVAQATDKGRTTVNP